MPLSWHLNKVILSNLSEETERALQEALSAGRSQA